MLIQLNLNNHPIGGGTPDLRLLPKLRTNTRRPEQHTYWKPENSEPPTFVTQQLNTQRAAIPQITEQLVTNVRLAVHHQARIIRCSRVCAVLKIFVQQRARKCRRRVAVMTRQMCTITGRAELPHSSANMEFARQ